MALSHHPPTHARHTSGTIDNTTVFGAHSARPCTRRAAGPGVDAPKPDLTTDPLFKVQIDGYRQVYHTTGAHAPVFVLRRRGGFGPRGGGNTRRPAAPLPARPVASALTQPPNWQPSGNQPSDSPPSGNQPSHSGP
jgi:hypothetical protein